MKKINIMKFILLLIITSISMSLISCNSALKAMGYKSDKEIADSYFQSIIDSIENKDKEGLKKMFSTSALNEAKDIDSQIDYIMDFFKGDIVSFEGGPGVESSSSHDGGQAVENNYDYTVETDKGKYFIFFKYISKDTYNSENVGLYMLQVINEKDKEIEYDGGQAIKCPGIYTPPITKYTNIKLEPGTDIAGGFKLLKYNVDNTDGKFNISATIKSNISYCSATIYFCFYNSKGEKIGVASKEIDNVEANSTFEIKLKASDYECKDLNYNDISSYKFMGIDAY
jgi:hypothetical protein